VTLKVQREKNPKVVEVVNQVSYRRGVQFYAFSVQFIPRSFGCANFTQIDENDEHVMASCAIWHS